TTLGRPVCPRRLLQRLVRSSRRAAAPACRALPSKCDQVSRILFAAPGTASCDALADLLLLGRSAPAHRQDADYLRRLALDADKQHPRLLLLVIDQRHEEPIGPPDLEDRLDPIGPPGLQDRLDHRILALRGLADLLLEGR